jgi:hypothetical protein
LGTPMPERYSSGFVLMLFETFPLFNIWCIIAQMFWQLARGVCHGW